MINDVGGAGAIANTVDVIAGVLVAGMVVEVGAIRPAGALQASSARMSEKLMSSSGFIVGRPGRFPKDLHHRLNPFDLSKLKQEGNR